MEKTLELLADAEIIVKPGNFKALTEEHGFQSIILGSDVGGSNFDWSLYMEDKEGNIHELAGGRIPLGYKKEKSETWAPSFIKFIDVFKTAAEHAKDYYQSAGMEFAPIKCGNSLAGFNNQFGADFRSTNCPGWHHIAQQLPDYQQFFTTVKGNKSINLLGLIQSLENTESQKLFSHFSSFNDLYANGANSVFISVAKGEPDVVTEMMGTGTNSSTWRKLPNGMIVGHAAESGWGYYGGRLQDEAMALEKMIKDDIFYPNVTHGAWEEVRSGRGTHAYLKFAVDQNLVLGSRAARNILNDPPEDPPKAISEAALKGDKACTEAFVMLGDTTGDFLYGRMKILNNPVIVLTQNIYSKNLEIIAKPMVQGFIDCMTYNEKYLKSETLSLDMGGGSVAEINTALRTYVTEWSGTGEDLIKDFFKGKIRLDKGTKTSKQGAAYLVTEKMLKQRPLEQKMAEQGTRLDFLVGEKSFTHRIRYYSPQKTEQAINGDVGKLTYPTRAIIGKEIPLQESLSESKPFKNTLRYEDIISWLGLVSHYMKIAGANVKNNMTEVQSMEEKAAIILVSSTYDKYCGQAARDWAKAMGYAAREVSLQFNFGQKRNIIIHLGNMVELPNHVKDNIRKAYKDTHPPAGPVNNVTTAPIRYSS
jgi:hypothetical protein